MVILCLTDFGWQGGKMKKHYRHYRGGKALIKLQRKIIYSIKTFLNQDAVMFCISCRKKIEYNGETVAEWSKKRICDDCKNGKKKNKRKEEVKFCRDCGKSFTFDEYNSLSKNGNKTERDIAWGWCGWYKCKECSQNMKSKNEIIRRHVIYCIKIIQEDIEELKNRNAI